MLLLIQINNTLYAELSLKVNMFHGEEQACTQLSAVTGKDACDTN